MSKTAAAFSRASHPVGGMLETHLFACPCVAGARRRCADPVGTVLGASETTRNGGSGAAYFSAGSVSPPVLVAMATFFLRI